MKIVTVIALVDRNSHCVSKFFYNIQNNHPKMFSTRFKVSPCRQGKTILFWIHKWRTEQKDQQSSLHAVNIM